MRRDDGRFFFVDMLRGCAMIVMIEVHVFNAFLRYQIRDAVWFQLINFVNGLVAPSFIFISGFTFILSSIDHYDDIMKLGRSFRKKLGRIMLIFALGYMIHIPYFSLKNNFIYTDERTLKSFYNVDVLQCIAIGLLMLLLARVIFRTDRSYGLFITVAMIAVLAIGPFIWHTDFSRYMPMPLACYFNELNGSFFPVFPWLGFLFGGALSCIIFLKARETGRGDELMRKTLRAAGMVSLLSIPLVTWLSLYPWFVIRPHPLYFVERIAIVLFLLGIFYFNQAVIIKWFSFVGDISSGSLLIYWLHLHIIYRSIWNDRSINEVVAGSFGASECFIATAILITSMVSVAMLWTGIKRANPVLAKWIFRCSAAYGLVWFSLR